MALVEHFGSLVGRLRVARNLSQEKLAHLCALHATTISEIERGKTNVGLETLVAVAGGLGIEPGHLVTMAVYDESDSDIPVTGAKAPGAAYGSSTRQLLFSIVAERTAAGYAAYCPDLPGCAATGDSRLGVERSMREAITAELESRRRAGRPIPEPTTYTAFISVPV